MPDKAKIQTELELLSALEEGGQTTQLALSRRLSVSVGLVNALLKRVVQKGMVKVKTAPRTRWAYYLTPHGFAEKSRLVAEYVESSLVFFRQARDQYAAVFRNARARGCRRVVLVGGGDLAEIALLAAREAEVDVCGVFDRASNTDHLGGVPILRSSAEIPPGAVLVITAVLRPQQVHDEILGWCDERPVLAPSFLHVSGSRRAVGADRPEGGEP